VVWAYNKKGQHDRLPRVILPFIILICCRLFIDLVEGDQFRDDQADIPKLLGEGTKQFGVVFIDLSIPGSSWLTIGPDDLFNISFNFPPVGIKAIIQIAQFHFFQIRAPHRFFHFTVLNPKYLLH
jgi:hypothetical protein